MFFEPVIRGVVVPAIVTTVILSACTLRPCTRARMSRAWATPLALGVGFLAGYAAVLGCPPMPPTENWMWLFYVAAVAIPVGVFERVASLPRGARQIAPVVVAVAAAFVLVPDWESLSGVRAAWVTGLALAGVIIWSMYNLLGRRLGSIAAPLGMLILAGGGAVVLALSGNAKFAQLAGVLAATSGAALAVALWNRSAVDGRGFGPLAGVLIPGLMLNGHFQNWSPTPTAAFALAALAPLLPLMGCIGRLGRQQGAKATAVRVTLTAAPAGIAIALAVLA